MMMSGQILAAEAIMEVIPLHNRSGSEIQELLKPLLVEDDSIVASHDSVIIKTLPTRLKNIQQTISKLDIPIQNLLISVMTSHENANNAVIVDSSTNKQGMSGFQGNTEIINERKNLQQIRTMDGQRTRIEIIRSRLHEDVSVLETGNGYRGFSTKSTRQQLGQGFSLIPHLQANNEVLIQIEPWSEREINPNSFDSQHAITSSRIPLGEWVDLFGDSPNKQREFTGMNHELHSNGNHLFIKVEKSNP